MYHNNPVLPKVIRRRKEKVTWDMEAVFGTVNDRFPVVETTSGKVRGIGRNGIAFISVLP